MKYLFAIVLLLTVLATLYANVIRIEVTKETQEAVGVVAQFKAEPGYKCSIVTITIPANQEKLKLHWQTVINLEKGNQILLSTPVEMNRESNGAQTAQFSIAEDLIPNTTITLRCKDEKVGVLGETFYNLKLGSYLPGKP